MGDCVSRGLQSQFYLPVLKPPFVGESLSLVKLKGFTFAYWIATEIASDNQVMLINAELIFLLNLNQIT